MKAGSPTTTHRPNSSYKFKFAVEVRSWRVSTFTRLCIINSGHIISEELTNLNCGDCYLVHAFKRVSWPQQSIQCTPLPPPPSSSASKWNSNERGDSTFMCKYKTSVSTPLDFTGNNQSILHQVFFITTLGKITEAFFKYFLLAGYHLMIWEICL